jgi:hypothetical protein
MVDALAATAANIYIWGIEAISLFSSLKELLMVAIYTQNFLLSYSLRWIWIICRTSVFSQCSSHRDKKKRECCIC